jgi:hypothetical protein
MSRFRGADWGQTMRGNDNGPLRRSGQWLQCAGETASTVLPAPHGVRSGDLSFVFRREHIQFEPDVFRQSIQPRALTFDPQQRVHANRVRRGEIVELENRWLRQLGTGLEQIGNVRFAETTGEMHDDATSLAAHFNPAMHDVDRAAKGDPAILRQMPRRSRRH